MAQWKEVEGAAKNDKGEYQALVNGSWRPVQGAAKNAEGKYMALMDDAAAPATAPAAPAEEPGFLSKVGSYAKEAVGAIAEPVAAMATGMVAKPLADVAGLIDIPLHAAGITSAEPADVQAAAQQALTYAPRTAAGGSAYNPLNVIPAAVGKVVGAITPSAPEDASTLGGMAKNVVREAIPQAIGFLPGGKVLGKELPSAITAAKELADKAVPAAIAGKATSVEATQTVENAKKAVDSGYKVPPHMVASPSKATELLTSPAGKAKTEMAASTDNAEVTNTIAKQDLGVSKDTLLNEKTFEDIRKRAGGAYKKLQEVSTPIRVDDKFVKQVQDTAGAGSFKADISGKNTGVADLVDTLTANEPRVTPSSLGQKVLGPKEFSAKQILEYSKELRNQSKSNLKSIGDNAPKSHEIGLAQRKMADSLEDLLDRNLKNLDVSSGDVEAFKKARERIAKSYDYESVTNTTTGNVNAHGLVRLADKGKPLSGGSKQIAEFASAFPKAARDVDKMGGTPELSKLDFAGMAAATVAGHPGAAGLVLAGPVARKVMLSKTYQRGMTGTKRPASAPSASQGARYAIAGQVAADAGLKKNRRDQ